MTALTQVGRLAMHDWERSVLGGAGNAVLSKAEAEARAVGQPDGRAVRDERDLPDRWVSGVARITPTPG